MSVQTEKYHFLRNTTLWVLLLNGCANFPSQPEQSTHHSPVTGEANLVEQPYVVRGQDSNFMNPRVNELTPGTNNYHRYATIPSGQPLADFQGTPLPPTTQYPAPTPHATTSQRWTSITPQFTTVPQYSPATGPGFRQTPFVPPSTTGIGGSSSTQPLTSRPLTNPLNSASQFAPSSGVNHAPRNGIGAISQTERLPPPPPNNYSQGTFPETVSPPGTVNSRSIAPPPPLSTAPGLGPNPYMEADIDVLVEEAQTGRFMFGVGVNSDAGVIGNIVVDERNFDLFRVPRSWQEVANGTAFRGSGQQFRLEALPGTQVQRYTASLTEPYLLGTQVSFNVSGFFFDRRFFDWDEERLGGRLGFGYRLTPDLSLGMTLRAEQVNIHDPKVLGVPELDEALGDSNLFGTRMTVSHDTRDMAFAPTEGHLLELSYEQVLGSYDYPRAIADFRQYFLIHERPDSSGRHTLGFSFRTGITGSQTPIFENFFAGGFSTIRGFDFRGASPVVGRVTVGGEFQFLGSVEYLFPLTADDMLRGVVFVDYGTVEENVEINSENYRVAPGFGMRLFVPAMGPAPIALDFAFPVAQAPFDEEQIFSFFIGFGR
ncbi:MAG: hypothetical protein CMJ62_11255 [Planctomycetaceae bacterium]|nr:hypothetical protein [Planctomycetaceae bacterium]